MDDYLKQILASAVPLNESLKSSDLMSSSKMVQSKIIDLFRFTSVQLAPSFLTKILGFIEEDAQSADKRKRHASAICLTAIIALYPFDHQVPLFSPIIDKLLKPGYKPLVQVGASVAGRIARINGPNRDKYLSILVHKSQTYLERFDNPDERYAAAVIWHELAHVAPELFYRLGTNFANVVCNALLNHDQQINEILTETIEYLFTSESASIGTNFLIETHNILMFTTIKNFSEVHNAEEIIGSMQILMVLLKLQPTISKRNAKNLLYPQCQKLISSPNTEIAFFALETIFQMARLEVIEITHEEHTNIFNILASWGFKQPEETLYLIQDMIEIFKRFDTKSCQQLLQLINIFNEKLPPSIGPPAAFEITITAIASFPNFNANISAFITNVRRILEKSQVPLQIHRLLAALNKSIPQWSSTFNMFKQQILDIIRQELTHQSTLTDRLVIVLHALYELPAVETHDAIDLASLIEKLMVSKDIDVRRLVVGAIVHLFKSSEGNLPLRLMIRMVKFAIDDSSRFVRLYSVKSFIPETYPYISQQEVFPTFCRFLNDEFVEVRQTALNVIKQLPIFNFTVVRNMMLSSLKQMNPNLSIIVPSTMPVWIVFPQILEASKPFLHLYAEGIFETISDMLRKRFTLYKDQTLIFANSTILREVDTSLIQSIQSLYLICPDIVPLQPIITILRDMFELPVHPWTKIVGMKSLKVLAESGVSFGDMLMPTLLDILQNNNNSKLLIKTLKVIGCLGKNKVEFMNHKKQNIFRSSITNISIFKNYFIQRIYPYLFKIFHSISIISVQESAFRCMLQIFHEEPSIIPDMLPEMVNHVLPFIKSMKGEKLSTFLNLLGQMISDSGIHIMKFIDTVYDVIKEHWLEECTNECSKNLSFIVKSTGGQCDSILTLVISNAFLLLKSRSNDNCVFELFSLLKTIVIYSIPYRQTIIAGIVDLLNTPEMSISVMDSCFDLIEYILTEMHPESLLSPIRRCLEVISVRSQMRWRDRASYLLAIMKENQRSSCTAPFVPQVQQKIVNFSKITIETFKAALKSLAGHIKATPIEISQSFEIFKQQLIKLSPIAPIRCTKCLEVRPSFLFPFAFFASYMSFDESEYKLISKRLYEIMKLPNLPDDVLLQLLNLIEFAVLSRIDLGIDTKFLIEKSIKLQRYDIAFSIIESIPLVKNTPITPDLLQDLSITNYAIGRKTDAYEIAKRVPKLEISAAMMLEDWTKALELISSEKEPDRYVTETVECLAEVEKWEDILLYSDKFDQQSLANQAKISRFFWTAEMNCGDKKKSLEYVYRTGGYNTEDCIQKAILFINLGDFDSAKETIHLGWRYLTANVQNIARNNKSMFEKKLFLAEQLHQLQEVLDCHRDKNYVSKFRKNWSDKLPQMRDDYERQNQLFQIVRLIPDAIDLDDFAINILSSTLYAKKQDEAMRLANLFFPDKNSQSSKYSKIMLLDSKERLETGLKSLDEFDGYFRKRLENQVGKDLFQQATSIEQLKEAETHLLKGDRNYDKITDTQIILANATGSEDIAISAIKAIKTRVTTKTKARKLYLMHLISLILKFCESESVCNSISDVFESLDSSIAVLVASFILTLITNKNKRVSETAVKIIHHAMQSLDEIFFFNLNRELQNHPDNELLEDLTDDIKRYHSITFSHINLISSGLIKMAHNMWGATIRLLSEFVESKSIETINKIVQVVSVPNYCHIESDFKKYFGKRLSTFTEEIINRGHVEEQDFEHAEELLLSMSQMQDSIRVIPISSFNQQLERKTTWQVGIPFSKAIEGEVKLTKFFHSVQNLENGLIVSMVGSDGRKYSFFLRRTKENIFLSDEFVSLLSATSPRLQSLKKRCNLMIAKDVSFKERIKGSTTLLNLIFSYRQSTASHEEISYEEQDVRLLILKERGKDDLAKSILTSSISAMKWAERQITFSKTLGIISALFYVGGCSDTSLNDILFDKASGALDYSSFIVNTHSQPVPFRLTAMLERALGTAGVNGTFRSYLVSTLEDIRSYKRGLAPALQFAVMRPPFDKYFVPTSYIGTFTSEFNSSEEVDSVYPRIKGFGSLEKEVDDLIKQATNVENLAKMPLSWIPWW
ncbi:FATC domain containing protein [Trichomonas vaginalis G3]|uniref:FATC domain containing protein n=1 Tax=Trichomonas vaginalis (strain ATCC PRA-98 / G3) TaxID=412133 RepID=A2FH95_TRIV3|nr:protein serine/threonine kinase protein [Trichomonas vaginalis G3]EAX95733.1 FATC domain containing protein [Trichomonas vaginalis G3]KAI5549309.1 protein serine/threonine kinase protein [Trichomonas vaginalis G3]|eukprot:XP_001308663.1 FATC domain containing protein [Trichomonas vaginalis G3]